MKPKTKWAEAHLPFDGRKRKCIWPMSRSELFVLIRHESQNDFNSARKKYYIFSNSVDGYSLENNQRDFNCIKTVPKLCHKE